MMGKITIETEEIFKNHGTIDGWDNSREGKLNCTNFYWRNGEC